MHPKTLVCTLLLSTSGKETDKKFFERVHQIMALCEDKTPIHLKIQAWHANNKKFGVTLGPPRLENIKELLMPRQQILKAMDPDSSQNLQMMYWPTSYLLHNSTSNMSSTTSTSKSWVSTMLSMYMSLSITLLVRLRGERLLSRVLVKAAMLMLCASMQHSLHRCSTQKLRCLRHTWQRNLDFERNAIS